MRIFIVMLAQLALISQVLAAAQLPCEAMNHSPLATADDVMMSHHNHLQMISSTSDELPCCDHKQCSKTHCASTGTTVAATVNGYASSIPELTGLHIIDYPTGYQSAESPSLFRPPISR